MRKWTVAYRNWEVTTLRREFERGNAAIFHGDFTEDLLDEADRIRDKTDELDIEGAYAPNYRGLEPSRITTTTQQPLGLPSPRGRQAMDKRAREELLSRVRVQMTSGTVKRKGTPRSGRVATATTKPELTKIAKNVKAWRDDQEYTVVYDHTYFG